MGISKHRIIKDNFVICCDAVPWISCLFKDFTLSWHWVIKHSACLQWLVLLHGNKSSWPDPDCSYPAWSRSGAPLPLDTLWVISETIFPSSFVLLYFPLFAFSGLCLVSVLSVFIFCHVFSSVKQSEWNCIVYLCWCAVKSLLTFHPKHKLNSLRDPCLTRHNITLFVVFYLL